MLSLQPVHLVLDLKVIESLALVYLRVGNSCAGLCNVFTLRRSSLFRFALIIAVAIVIRIMILVIDESLLFKEILTTGGFLSIGCRLSILFVRYLKLA